MRNVRWVWILICAWLAELLGYAVLMGIRVLHGIGPFSLDPLSPLGDAAFQIELFLVFALFGWWVARGARGLVVVNGLLVGLGAVLIYEIAARASGHPPPFSVTYLLLHAVKIAGGAVGGWIAALQRASSAAPRTA